MYEHPFHHWPEGNFYNHWAGTNMDLTDDIVQDAIAQGKEYCLFLYKSGPTRDQPPEEAKKIQSEHLFYLFRLRSSGKLILNGPVLSEGELRGIGIFDTKDRNEAAALLESDPAIRSGRLRYEVYDWFGIPGDTLPR